MQVTILACLAAVLVLAPAVRAQAACQEGWEGNGKRCFKFFDDEGKMKYAEADTLCKKHGAIVASIFDEDDQAIVHKLSVRKNAWLSGKVNYLKNRLSWKEGGPTEYTNWNKREPKATKGRQCMKIYGNGFWATASCSLKMKAMCGYPDPSYVAPTPKPPFVPNCREDQYVLGNRCRSRCHRTKEFWEDGKCKNKKEEECKKIKDMVWVAEPHPGVCKNKWEDACNEKGPDFVPSKDDPSKCTLRPGCHFAFKRYTNKHAIGAVCKKGLEADVGLCLKGCAERDDCLGIDWNWGWRDGTKYYPEPLVDCACWHHMEGYKAFPKPEDWSSQDETKLIAHTGTDHHMKTESIVCTNPAPGE